MSDLEKKINEFPTQLILTLIWGIVGLAVCLILRNSLIWVILMSWYAIVVSHFTAHTAWRAKREAEKLEEERNDNKKTKSESQSKS